MLRKGKAHATMLDDLSSIPKAYMVERTHHRLSSDLHTYAWQVHTDTNTSKYT